MEVKKSILPNGLRLITANIPGLESVTCLVLTGVGSRYETKEKLGISHVLEHMAFKGTKKRPTPREIATLVEGVGASWNAFTWKEMTGYWIKLGSNHLDLALDVISDTLLNSVLDEKEIKKEIGVVLEERKMYLDTPIRHIQDLIDQQVLGDQPVGWDTLGTPESLSAIERPDLVNFITTYYKAENMVIAVAGKIPEDIEVRVQRYFGDLPVGKTPGYKAAVVEQSKPRAVLNFRKTEQAHIAIGVEGVSYLDQDHFPLQVLDVILGQGMSSRLFVFVREKKGLAYTVRSNNLNFHDTGTFFVYAGVDLKKADQSVTAILQEMKKLATEKVNVDELNKGKEFLKGGIKLALEDTREVAEMFGLRELLEKRVLTEEEISNLIDRVTAEDILRVATRLFRTEKLNLSLIGPFEDGNRFLKLLQV